MLHITDDGFNKKPAGEDYLSNNCVVLYFPGPLNKIIHCLLDTFTAMLFTDSAINCFKKKMLCYLNKIPIVQYLFIKV